MFLTNILLKRAKAKNILVQLESVVSGHHYFQIRERLGEKLEMMKFDPYIQRMCVYREKRKIKSIR